MSDEIDKLPEESVRNCLEDLFGKNIKVEKELTAMCMTIDNQEKMITGINKSLTCLEDMAKDTKLVLYGDKDKKYKGLIDATAEQETVLGKHKEIITKIGIAIVVAAWFIKEFGIWDSLVSK